MLFCFQTIKKVFACPAFVIEVLDYRQGIRSREICFGHTVGIDIHNTHHKHAVGNQQGTRQRTG